MEDVIEGFEQLKISAFRKVQQVNDDIIDVTLGPNSFLRKPHTNLLPKNHTLENVDPQIAGVSEVNIPVRHIIKQLDLDRQNEVKCAVESRSKKFEEFSRGQQKLMKESWLREQRAFIENMQQKEMQILQSLEKYDRDCSNRQAKLDKQYQEVEERRRKQQQALEAKERERHKLVENLGHIQKHQQEFSLIYEEILILIKSCEDSEVLRTSLGENFKLLKSLPESIEKIIAKCKTGKFSDEEILKTEEILNKIKNLKTTITNQVHAINEKKKEQEKQKVIAEPPKIETLPTNIIQQKPEPPKSVDKTDSATAEKNVVKDLTKYISITNMALYVDLMDFLENHQKLFKQLEEDQSLKQYKFDLKKAINIPVNALSGVNSEHILDKYVKLHKLLAGQIVSVSDKQVSAAKHPQGITFCMDLLAKKFVLQGDLIVSSNPESAFCYASLILSLWNDFPDFGKLILAYFYKYCPYLVPYYIPKAVGESEEEFYTKQGYKYTEGQIEQQDKFLKRMTGIARLYFALIIAKPKKGQQFSPYNLRHGWRWISSILKLEPRLDITATMLHTFLETVGFEMQARYGKQFAKLLKILMQVYFAKCKENCVGGAGTRLELLLTKCVKDGKFEPPNGYIPYPYW